MDNMNKDINSMPKKSPFSMQIDLSKFERQQTRKRDSRKS